jgi:hypothetical protein
MVPLQSGVVSIGEAVYVKVVEVIEDDGSGRGPKIQCSIKVRGNLILMAADVITPCRLGCHLIIHYVVAIKVSMEEYQARLLYTWQKLSE